MTALTETPVPGSAGSGAVVTRGEAVATPRVVGVDPRCGTLPGYQAHGRRGDAPCQSCKDSRNAARRAREAAKPKPPRRDTLAERFWAKVDKDGPVPSEPFRPLGDNCWTWTAYIDTNGYGRLSVGGRAGRMRGAHVVSYWIANGQWPPSGMELDHLCRVRHCVNPSHLEVVTHEENSRRNRAAEVNAARQRAITHCPDGHSYDDANTAIRTNGARRCKTCDRDRAREARRS